MRTAGRERSFCSSTHSSLTMASCASVATPSSGVSTSLSAINWISPLPGDPTCSRRRQRRCCPSRSRRTRYVPSFRPLIAATTAVPFTTRPRTDCGPPSSTCVSPGRILLKRPHSRSPCCTRNAVNPPHSLSGREVSHHFVDQTPLKRTVSPRAAVDADADADADACSEMHTSRAARTAVWFFPSLGTVILCGG